MPLQGPPLEKPIDFQDILGIGLSTTPDKPALVSRERAWTFRELDEASQRIAAHYLDLGLAQGDRVASLMPNRGALIVHYLACIRAGLVAAPLNYRYMPPEIDHALGLSGAAAILAHAERAQDLADSELAGDLARGWISYGGDLPGARPFEDLLETDNQTVIPPPVSRDAPAFIYFTSGSTGKPKGVTHSCDTYGWLVASLIESHKITSDDSVLGGSSISHIGSCMYTFAGLAAGARVDVARTFDGDELLPLMRDTQATIMLMLPAALITVVRDHGATSADFASLRLCVCGGDQVSPTLEDEFTELAGIHIDEIYGMTEIGVSNMSPVDGENRLGSVGTATAGYELSIRDDGGAEVAPGEDGRLWVRSPTSMVGYWDNPAATADTIVDGWLDTGDVMRADQDGYLWFRGRKKQIIIHDGSNISPQEVEATLLEQDPVASAGVVGVHDLVHGENVRAYVTIKDGFARPKAVELIKHSRSKVGYKAPETIVFLDEMPLNATGKVDRVTLKRLAEEEHEAAAAPR